ncbi:DUF5079 family protein [Staphylococcus caprae]|uniref:DUF5079 family protein n=2 Tax=Staphylococcus caprae TaxID=29380 RepID=UPI001F5ABFCB|nr:DUF5079 family protein [Staphylococcus caprae]MCI2954282.1 DUF5079 family protein [Staphylococcus caprae]
MINKVVSNIKKAYLVQFGIVINALFLLLCGIMLPLNNAYTRIPIYLICFFVFWIIINFLSFIQERKKKVNISKSSIIRYFVINTLCGYSLVIIVATLYFIGATVNNFNVGEYWIYILITYIFSWIGLHLFCISEFEIIQTTINGLLKIIGIIIALASIVSILYLSFIVPRTAEENKFIWASIIALIAVYAILIRSYFNYSLYLTIKKSDKEKQ